MEIENGEIEGVNSELRLCSCAVYSFGWRKKEMGCSTGDARIPNVRVKECFASGGTCAKFLGNYGVYIVLL